VLGKTYRGNREKRKGRAGGGKTIIARRKVYEKAFKISSFDPWEPKSETDSEKQKTVIEKISKKRRKQGEAFSRLLVERKPRKGVEFLVSKKKKEKTGNCGRMMAGGLGTKSIPVTGGGGVRSEGDILCCSRGPPKFRKKGGNGFRQAPRDSFSRHLKPRKKKQTRPSVL